MVRDTRTAAVRQRVGVTIRVSGLDKEGNHLQEETMTCDISEEGISFYLRTTVWMSSYLKVKRLESEQGSEGSRTMIIRIKTESFGCQLVAARFDSEHYPLRLPVVALLQEFKVFYQTASLRCRSTQ